MAEGWVLHVWIGNAIKPTVFSYGHFVANNSLIRGNDSIFFRGSRLQRRDFRWAHSDLEGNQSALRHLSNSHYKVNKLSAIPRYFSLTMSD